MPEQPFPHFGHRRWIKQTKGMVQSNCSCGWRGHWLWSDESTVSQWVDHFDLEQVS